MTLEEMKQKVYAMIEEYSEIDSMLYQLNNIRGVKYDTIGNRITFEEDGTGVCHDGSITIGFTFTGNSTDLTVKYVNNDNIININFFFIYTSFILYKYYNIFFNKCVKM